MALAALSVSAALARFTYSSLKTIIYEKLPSPIGAG